VVVAHRGVGVAGAVWRAGADAARHATVGSARGLRRRLRGRPVAYRPARGGGGMDFEA
jgi:hypothetical protein